MRVLSLAREGSQIRDSVAWRWWPAFNQFVALGFAKTRARMTVKLSVDLDFFANFRLARLGCG